MREIVIMRGLPDAGQEEWVAKNLSYPFIEHSFQPFLARLAATAGTTRPIAVMGAHCNLWEVSPYVYIARCYGAPCRVVSCLRQPERGNTKEERMYEMLRYAVLPEEWCVEEVVNYKESAAWFKSA